MKSLYLIDTPNIIFRAFHALPLLTNSRGFPTNAVMGTSNMLIKLFREEKPDAIVAAFDAPEKTFRDEMFAEYKAERGETPSELSPQFPVIKQVLDGFRVKRLEMPGFEADDIIATLACRARREGWRVVIVSGDKDLMQLVDDDRVMLLDTMKDKLYDRDGVIEKWGVPPEKLGDVLALMGDKIDNVPGIPGIGQKTAVKLVNDFGSLENLLSCTTSLKGKQRENVEKYADQARLSRKLVALHEECEIPESIEDFARIEPDKEALVKLFRELEFNRLTAAFEEEEAVRAEVAVHDVESSRVLTSVDELDDAFATAGAGDVYAFELLLEDGDSLSDAPVGLAFARRSDEAGFYLPLTGELTWKAVLPTVQSFFEREDVRRVAVDAKSLYLALMLEDGETVGPVDDIGLMSYLLNPSRPSQELGALANEYLQRRLPGWDTICGTGRNTRALGACTGEEVAGITCHRADAMLRLLDEIEPQLIASGLMSLYVDIERPLVPVLARLERAGVKVDRDHLGKLSEELAKTMGELEAKIFDIAGGQFNIQSPRQLNEIMFEKLGYATKGIKKTKTGQFTTDSDALEKLALEYPLPRLILQYRTVAKLKGTYVDALPPLIRDDGRIHCRFNQLVTATGRLSSSDPNLQNIPIRDEEGRRIRQAFVAEEGMVMMSFDYSQVELRLLAHIADDAILQESFRNSEDVHRRTASEVFGVDPTQVDDNMRRKAKAVNFGIAYGQTAYGLSTALGIGTAEAQDIINRYFERYEGVKRYIQRMPEEARQGGFVSTLFGRRRLLPDIMARNMQVRQFAERTAINTPIQGTAADMIKIAMVRVDEALRERKLRTRMTLQVHDELLFEVPHDEKETVRGLVREIMEGVIALTVPLVVDVGEGISWAEAH